MTAAVTVTVALTLTLTPTPTLAVALLYWTRSKTIYITYQEERCPQPSTRVLKTQPQTDRHTYMERTKLTDCICLVSENSFFAEL